MTDYDKECVDSVLEDNPEMEKGEAIAICRSQQSEQLEEIVTLEETGIGADELEQLAGEDDDWSHETPTDGISLFVSSDAGAVVYQADDVQEGDETDQQAATFGADVFRIVQDDDSEMDLESDVMGVGVDFPNAGVYVDWNIDAWPDDEQLSEAHVSDYGSIEDLEQATGGTVEHLETIDAIDATDD